MAFGHREYKGFFEQQLGVQLVVGHRQGQDGHIQTAVAQPGQQHVALFLDQQQFQLGEALAYLRHHVRQQVRAKGGEDAQPHGARFGILLAPGGLFHLLHLGHDPPRALGCIEAGGGQHYPAWGAFHQGHAQLFLELADLGGQGRLADEARGRGTAEMLVVGQRDQVVDVAQVHGRAAWPARAITLPRLPPWRPWARWCG